MADTGAIKNDRMRAGARPRERADSDAAGSRPAESTIALALALLSVGAAAIHFSVAGAHFSETWLHGTFFVMTGWAQAIWAGAALLRPSRLVWWAGIVINGGTIVAWIVSRTVGVPFGPNAGVAEPVAMLDVVATTFEGLIIAGCLVLLFGWFAKRSLTATAATIAALLLIQTVGVTTALAFARSGGEHGHGGSESSAMGDDHHGGEGGDHAGALLDDDPLLEEMDGILTSQGTEAAFARLTEAIAADPAVQGLSHVYAHNLGMRSFQYYGSAGAAFPHCDASYESGCYHGVLQGYFDANPDFSPKDVATICDEAAGGPEYGFVRFQCIHGLGHGLTMFYDHDLAKPLRYCQFLRDGWSQDSCYGGVFMENIVYSQAQQQTGGTFEDTFIREDPLYPCNVVNDRYRHSCYQMQTSVILPFVNYDYPAAFDECEKAPGKYVLVCYSSMGRDIAGATLQNATESVAKCSLGDPKYVQACISGAAQTFVNIEGKTEGGVEFCTATPEHLKTPCYNSVGSMLISIFTDESQRALECEKVEPAYVKACLRGALLPTNNA